MSNQLQSGPSNTTFCRSVYPISLLPTGLSRVEQWSGGGRCRPEEVQSRISLFTSQVLQIAFNPQQQQNQMKQHEDRREGEREKCCLHLCTFLYSFRDAGFLAPQLLNANECLGLYLSYCPERRRLAS